MVEKQGFEEKEELKSKLESAMEEKFKMEKVRLLFPLFFCVFFCLTAWLNSDEQSWRMKRIAIGTFDTMLERHVCLTRSCDFVIRK